MLKKTITALCTTLAPLAAWAGVPPPPPPAAAATPIPALGIVGLAVVAGVVGAVGLRELRNRKSD